MSAARCVGQLPVKTTLWFAWQTRLPASHAFFDQIGELIEEVRSVMRTGRGFGMILHAEDRQFVVPHSFHGSVVQIYVRHFHVGRQRLGIDRETVILRRDRHFTVAQILHRLIRAVMPEFQFEGRPPKANPRI